MDFEQFPERLIGKGYVMIPEIPITAFEYRYVGPQGDQQTARLQCGFCMGNGLVQGLFVR